MKKAVTVIAFMLLILSSALATHAQDQAADDPVLTVQIQTIGSSETQTVELTMAQLTALPASSFTTTTHWTTGPQQFEGVWLSTLLQFLGVTDGHLELLAINDYGVTLPVVEVTTEGELLAYHRNGAPMPRREKGPLWLVYNYDSNSAFRTETAFVRSIWQLDRIVISR